jgi:hypothetical protein
MVGDDPAPRGRSASRRSDDARSGGDERARRTPRRRRTETKAWLYLALFGSGGDSDGPDGGSTPGAESGDGRTADE